MTTENKIVVQNEHRIDEEDGEVDSGSADITPGYLVDYYGASDYTLHTTTVEVSPEVRVARKQGEIGHETTDTVSAGDNLKVANCHSGAVVELHVASGTDLGTGSEATISEGDRLVTAGGATAGTVKAFDSVNDADGAVFAVAREAVDNSGASAGVTARITAEVL